MLHLLVVDLVAGVQNQLHLVLAAVALLAVLVELMVMAELEYAAAKDFLLDLKAREFLLHVPYLQVLLCLFHDLDLENIDERNTKKLFSGSNYFKIKKDMYLYLYLRLFLLVLRGTE